MSCDEIKIAFIRRDDYEKGDFTYQDTLIDYFIKGEEDLPEILNQLNLGKRKRFENTENFELMTPLRTRLLINDVQAFKILFNEVMK